MKIHFVIYKLILFLFFFSKLNTFLFRNNYTHRNTNFINNKIPILSKKNLKKSRRNLYHYLKKKEDEERKDIFNEQIEISSGYRFRILRISLKIHLFGQRGKHGGIPSSKLLSGMQIDSEMGGQAAVHTRIHTHTQASGTHLRFR